MQEDISGKIQDGFIIESPWEPRLERKYIIFSDVIPMDIDDKFDLKRKRDDNEESPDEHEEPDVDKPLETIPTLDLNGETKCTGCKKVKPNSCFISIKLKNRLCKTCDSCREDDKKYNKQFQAKVAEMPLFDPNDDSVQLCRNCGKYEDKSGFVALDGKLVIRCGNCLSGGRKAEYMRGKRPRTEKDRERDRSEKTRRRKRLWDIKHRDKRRAYDKKHKNKKMMEDAVGTRKKNADRLREFRKRHPEKQKQYQERQKRTITYRLAYYKNRALDKEYAWELTDQQFEELCRGDCLYCRLPAVDALYGFNGVDRLDSDGGYTTINSKSCCTNCNMSKGQLSYEQHMANCARIVGFNFDDVKLDNVADLIMDFPYSCSNGVSFQRYVERAERKNIEFTITEAEFDDIVRRKCYLCGNFPGIQCGVDRVDNSLGYIPENCQPCCKNCNYLKRDQNIGEFLNRCKETVENFYSDDSRIVSAPKERMARKKDKKKVIKLSQVEKGNIVIAQRSKMKNWAIIQSRVELNKATDDEIQQIKDLEERIKVEQAETLKKKKLKQ